MRTTSRVVFHRHEFDLLISLFLQPLHFTFLIVVEASLYLPRFHNQDNTSVPVYLIGTLCILLGCSTSSWFQGLTQSHIVSCKTLDSFLTPLLFSSLYQNLLHTKFIATSENTCYFIISTKECCTRHTIFNMNKFKVF